jgi:predicted DNA-binding transcriptional regulator AlpA
MNTPSDLNSAAETYLRERDVLARLPVSRATWWRLVAANPETLKPVKLGPRVTVWNSRQLDEFVRQRAAEAA